MVATDDGQRRQITAVAGVTAESGDSGEPTRTCIKHSNKTMPAQNSMNKTDLQRTNFDASVLRPDLNDFLCFERTNTRKSGENNKRECSLVDKFGRLFRENQLTDGALITKKFTHMFCLQLAFLTDVLQRWTSHCTFISSENSFFEHCAKAAGSFAPRLHAGTIRCFPTLYTFSDLPNNMLMRV